MNLDNLKAAWRQYRVLNSLENIDNEEILFIIEQADSRAVSFSRIVTNALLFIALTVCCQGG